MQNDIVLVRIVVVKVLRKILQLLCRVGRLFTEVPVQSQVMTVAGNQFAIIQLALRSQVAAIKQLVVFGFLCFEVQVQTFRVGMLENDLPLIQARHVHSCPFVIGRVREDILVVPIDVHRQKRNGIQALRCKVVECTDQFRPLASVPTGIAEVPILLVRGPRLDRLGLAVERSRVVVPVRLEGPVKVLIGKQVLGSVGTLFDEVLAGARELQIVLADIFETSFARKSSPVLSVAPIVKLPVKPSNGASEVPAVGLSLTATSLPVRNEIE